MLAGLSECRLMRQRHISSLCLLPMLLIAHHTGVDSLRAAVSPDAGLVAAAGPEGPSCPPCSTTAGSLWSNGGCDGFGAIASYERSDHALPLVQAADDFWITPSCGEASLERVRVQMALLPLDEPPTTGRLEIFADAAGQPAAGPPLASVDFVAAPEVVGCIRSGQFLVMVHELELTTTGLTLPPGHYWLSPVGWNKTGIDFFLYATAGGGQLRMSEAVWHNPAHSSLAWNPVSTFPFFQDRPGDFAFEVDGGCANLLSDGFETADLRGWTPQPLR